MLGGKFNLGSLLKNAKKIQEVMQKTKEELSKMRVTGEAGAGLIKITVSGQHETIQVELSDEVLKEPKTVIEELIAAACNNAHEKIFKITQEKMMNPAAMFDLSSEEESEK